MNSDISALRAALTGDQRSILDQCWRTSLENKGNSWPSVPEIQIVFGKRQTLAAIETLPRGALFSESGQYRLSLLGILLTTDGQWLLHLLADYLAYVRDAYRASVQAGSPLKVIQSTTIPLLRGVPEERIAALAWTIHRAQLGGERPPAIASAWVTGVPASIADIADAPDLLLYVSEHARQQAERLADTYGPRMAERSPLWYVEHPELRRLLELDLAEFRRVHEIGATKSSVLLAGGIMEGVLLDALGRTSAGKSAVSPAQHADVDTALDRLELEKLIARAADRGILPQPVKHLSQALREFRNLVHPGRQLREGITLTADEARVAFDILEMVLRAVAAREAGEAARDRVD